MQMKTFKANTKALFTQTALFIYTMPCFPVSYLATITFKYEGDLFNVVILFGTVEKFNCIHVDVFKRAWTPCEVFLF